MLSHLRSLAFTVSSCLDSYDPGLHTADSFFVKCHLLKATCSETLPGVLFLLRSVSLVSKLALRWYPVSLGTGPGAICHLCTVSHCVIVCRCLFQTSAYIIHDSEGFLPGACALCLRENLSHAYFI